MNFYRILYRLAAFVLAGFCFWNGETLEGIGWFVLIELDAINHKLPSLPKKPDPESEAKVLASIFQASFDKQSKDN
jgi:hypothetical protein